MPDDTSDRPVSAAVYARVSSSENKSNLDSQARRVQQFANLNGLPVTRVVKECGSGSDDSRKKLLKLLEDPEITHIVVEHKDRLTRFGFEYLKGWVQSRGAKIVVANEVLDDRQDLMQDFVSLVKSFGARLYGLGRSRRKTEQLIKDIQAGWL